MELLNCYLNLAEEKVFVPTKKYFCKPIVMFVKYHIIGKEMNTLQNGETINDDL